MLISSVLSHDVLKMHACTNCLQEEEGVAGYL
jgi:hypothetical protein